MSMRKLSRVTLEGVMTHARPPGTLVDVNST
jgi:hypothetical protein